MPALFPPSEPEVTAHLRLSYLNTRISFHLISMLVGFCLASCTGIGHPTGTDSNSIGGPIGNPQRAYADGFPTPRPGLEQLAFVREVGSAHDTIAVEGIYLLDVPSRQVQLLRLGYAGKLAWLDQNTLCFPDLTTGGGGRLVSIDLVSGEENVLSQYPVQNPSVSPRWNHVAYDHAGTIWLLNLFDDARSVIATRAYDPSFSPDGAHIAIVSYAGRNSVELLSMSGATLGGLVSSRPGVFYSHPSWNRSGTRLVVAALVTTSQGYSTQTIVTVDLVEGTWPRYGDGILKGMEPAFMGEDRIVFTWYNAGTNFETRIFSARISGDSIVQLTR